MTAKRILPLCMLAAFCVHSTCLAQLPAPRITTLFPPGVQRGQTVEVTVTGSDLEGLSGLHFSGPGLSVSEVAGNKLKVTAAADAPLGPVDVRAVGAWGVSNVRRFDVSDLPEVAEVEPNNLKQQAKPVGLNVIVNGRADARSDVDYFTFPVEKGQTVVVDCFAERIDSRMTPVLTLFTPTGHREAIEPGYSGKDPRHSFTASMSGTYMVRVHDLTYDGSGEYFYRLSISTRPTVASAFPPVVSIQQPGDMTVTGLNLQADSLTQKLEAPKDFAANPRLDASLFLQPNQVWIDGYGVRPTAAETQLRPVLVGVSNLPVATEQEPNDDVTQANLLPFPVDMVGRINGRNDRDCFRFSAKQGQAIQLNALAERLGSPVDLVVVLRRIVPGPEGQPPQVQDVAEYDDFATNVGRTKLDTSTHDPVTALNIPADGDYLLEVADQFAGAHSGPNAVYRLQLAPPQPDFRLAVVPAEENAFSSVVIRKGGTAYVHVFAVRQDGFAGEIRVQAVGLPPGITAPPVVMGPGVNEVPLVFTAAADAADFTGAIEIRGEATIGSATVMRSARGSEIIWSGAADAAKSARLTQEFVLACRNAAPYRLETTPNEVTLSQGALLTVDLKLHRLSADFVGPLADVTAVHLPANVENEKGTIPEKQDNGTLHFYFTNNAPVGTYTFLAMGNAKLPFTKTPEDPNAKKADITVSDPSLPITVTVLPRVLELTAAPNTPTVKPGEKTTVKVTVKRVNNYQGPVTLRLTTPAGLEGLTAPEVTVPADQTEATMEIACAAEVPEGDKAFVTVRGSVPDDPQKSVDAKLTVKVAK